MFAPPWHTGLFAATTALEFPSLSAEQSQATSLGMQSLGFGSGKMHAYCNASKAGMFCSWPLIGLACGFVELAGEIAMLTIGFVPVRCSVVSIMNGSVGSTGDEPFAGWGTPSSTGQRPLSSNCLAVRYLSPDPLREASSAMSCHGTPTMPTKKTSEGSRGALFAPPA